MLDTAAIRARYAAERDKRVRQDGNDQYLELLRLLAAALPDLWLVRG
jgi:hypothetical protein